jgi:excisionase family DNA binding protein
MKVPESKPTRSTVGNNSAGIPAPGEFRPHELQPGLSQLAVDLAEAARLIGVSAKTMRREIDRGRLRAFKVGRLVRVRTAELQAYLKRLEGGI